ncbi:MAG: hypothetical protein GXO18_01030 [Aquificae bacterium]|nr:hypothetical protein [Aquificota bacterium]
MSKEFKPLFGIEKVQEEEEKTFQEDLNRILKEKNRLENLVKTLEEELKTLQQEKKKLLEERNTLRIRLEEMEGEISKLKHSLQENKVQEEIIHKLAQNIKGEVDKVKEEVREEFIQLSKVVLKEFLMTDFLPKEELISKVLEGIFERGIDLKGELKVFVNPSQVEGVFEFIAGLGERMEDKFNIEVVGDETLKVGEVRVESPKFVIERLNEEAIEEIFREVVRNALEGD